MKPQFSARIACLCAALLLLAASCGMKPDAIPEGAGVGRLITTEYPCEIVLTPHVEGTASSDGITCVDARDGLDGYITLYKDCYDFENTSVTTCFYDVASPYDEAFFEENVLLIIPIRAASPAVRYVCEGIGRAGEGFDIRIGYTSPSPAVEQETDWHLLIEVPKNSACVEDPSLLNLRFVEKRNY